MQLKDIHQSAWQHGTGGWATLGEPQGADWVMRVTTPTYNNRHRECPNC